MTELRRDPIMGQWVIVHTQDSWGPERYEKELRRRERLATCQFCPGKEFMTPPEIEAIRPAGSPANAPGWRVRVVPNRFPALRIEGNLDELQEGVYTSFNGIGAHEVLIETPLHDKNLAELADEEMANVISKYQSRLVDLRRDKRFKYIVLFRNYGESAGATVGHPHSQIIALPMVPKYVLQELQGAQKYYEENGRCVYCDILAQEYADQERIIAENEHFVVFCPFAPRYPFESWIFPKKHSADFSAIEEKERYDLGRILKDVLFRMKACLNDPSYNYYYHVSPMNSKGEDHEPSWCHGGKLDVSHCFHWHIEIVPQLTRATGFERGTGFYMVRTDPRLAAGYLRGAPSPNPS